MKARHLGTHALAVGILLLGTGGWAVAVDITADTTWDLAGGPYIINGPVYIYNGATLTIDPGVTVQLHFSAFIRVGRNSAGDETDQGAIVANGTELNPISFVRSTATNWRAIIFEGRGFAPMASSLSHCLVDHGGYQQTAAVEFYNHSNVVMSDCSVTLAAARGIYCDPTSRPTIQNNTVSDSIFEPVRIAAENAGALSGNTYTGNNPDVVTVYGDVTHDETWQDEDVDYWPDTYFTIRNSATLTLSPGVTLGLFHDTCIFVGRNVNGDASDRGALVAIGTEAEPVTLYKRTGSNWRAIVFDGTGFAPMASTLSRCVLNNAGYLRTGAVEFLNHSDVTMSDCTVYQSVVYGIYCDPTSRPAIQNNTVDACSNCPVRIAAENVDALSGNTYTNCSPNAVSTYGDVTRDVTWPNEGVPYYPDAGDMTVRNSATLTLDPGVSLGLDNSSFVRIGRNVSGAEDDSGAIYAVGTELEPITLYKRTGTNWRGLIFDGSGYPPLASTLDHCVVDQGGYTGTQANIRFINHSNCTITNTTIGYGVLYGVHCDATSAPTLTNDLFQSNGHYPLLFYIDNPPTIVGNTYDSNGYQAIYLYGDVAKNATLINDGIPYWRVSPENEIDIYNDAVLTIAAGVTMYLEHGAAFRVGWDPVNGVSARGALRVNGTLAKPVTLARYSGTNWRGITFDGRAGASPKFSRLTHCVVDTAGYTTNYALGMLEHSNVTVEHCTISNAS
jgi:parallel beta-helix repeat protein